MQFGLFISAQHPVGEDMVRRAKEHLQQVEAAREAGFDQIFYGEHFLMPPFQMLHQATFLSRCIAEAGHMKIASGIFLVALHNPVELADMAATLDILSEGRFVFGVGLGYRQEEFDAFGVPKERAAEVFEDKLQIIKRLWTEDNITHEGIGYKLVNATNPNRPVQKPHPPIWIAANNNRAVERAARMGDAWYINPHANMETLRKQVKLYNDTLIAEGKSLDVTRPLMKELYIAETAQKAIDVARPFLERKYKVYVDWGQSEALPKSDTLDQEFEKLAQDRFVLGGPDEVIRQLERYVQELGVNFLSFRLQWPGMDNESTLKAIKLVGEHVIPYFKEKYGDK